MCFLRAECFAGRLKDQNQIVVAGGFQGSPHKEKQKVMSSFSPISHFGLIDDDFLFVCVAQRDVYVVDLAQENTTFLINFQTKSDIRAYSYSDDLGLLLLLTESGSLFVFSLTSLITFKTVLPRGGQLPILRNTSGLLGDCLSLDPDLLSSLH
jgi:hypothetical protein